jgi:hypothetical protein
MNKLNYTSGKSWTFPANEQTQLHFR